VRPGRAAAARLPRAARVLLGLRPLRRASFALLRRMLDARADGFASAIRRPADAEADERALRAALLNVAERVLAEQRLSEAAIEARLAGLMREAGRRLQGAGARQLFRAEHGCAPPAFLFVSVGESCNLRCDGCRAAGAPGGASLSWPTLERLVREASSLWGTRVVVLSGGEPLTWRNGHGGVLELARDHPDCLFVLHTNGTLIDDAVARGLGELGNVAAALSLDGGRAATDARRGAGAFAAVLAAMERLRRERALYGACLNVGRGNGEELLSDELVDLLFGRMGVLFALLLEQMPRGHCGGTPPTPRESLRLRERRRRLVRERGIYLADLWSGALRDRCLAGGAPGGYLHVSAGGWASPCAFLPHAALNLDELYAKGGDLDALWRTPLMAAVRSWQRDYASRADPASCAPCGNARTPCLVRDHPESLAWLLEAHAAHPLERDA
jgi:MoaA/NifB/PqqE/SkfB family radical SAM enzyme